VVERLVANDVVLEKTEGIELMRSLENRQKIGTFIVKGNDFAIDINANII